MTRDNGPSKLPSFARTPSGMLSRDETEMSQKAASAVDSAALDLGGEGGVIAIDAQGEIAIEFNSEGMFRASRKAGGEACIAVYR